MSAEESYCAKWVRDKRHMRRKKYPDRIVKYLKKDAEIMGRLFHYTKVYYQVGSHTWSVVRVYKKDWIPWAAW